ncbi:MAG TPA: ankyrin repeat domain-containing protein, partial [Chthonomonadaceae bacterium]|nr:ankyrin repeat domain-containing protein [Chthonomonadaceae bacterium]
YEVEQYPACRMGPSPILVYAATDGRAAIVSELLDKGANINAADLDGQTALITACEFIKPLTARNLIARGADVQAKDIQGRTALMLAAETGQVDLVDLLLSKGSNVAAKDQDGDTAQSYAKRSGHRNIVSRLQHVTVRN